MNRYKVTGPRPVQDAEPGDEFEHDFTAAEESGLLAQRRIALVPRPYRVVGSRRVNDTDPGGEFLGAFRVDQEAALLEAGHIERVAAKKPGKAKSHPDEGKE